MRASYRLVHYAPDPFTGTRFALGAIVADADGQVRVAKAARIPSADCLGDRDHAVAVQRLVARLDGVRAFDALPSVFGPYATLGESQAVPAGVPDAVTWVAALLDSRRAGAQHIPKPQGPRRGSLGFRFFETWNVDRYVRKTFEPASDWDGWLGHQAGGLDPITHWVPGDRRVLLMEPILPGRAHFEADLKEVGRRFLSYRGAVDLAGDARQASLVAYVMAGGEPDRRAHVREVLGSIAHRVVDTDDAGARSAFLDDVRRIGSEVDPHRLFAADA